MLTAAVTCHDPPASGLRASVPSREQPLPVAGLQAAVSASTWPSITSSDTMEPPGAATLAQCSPPSVVSHNPLPNTKPIEGVANRMPQTADPVVFSGWPSGTTGAGSPCQVPPRFSVRSIDVQGLFTHGAVPSTNAC